MRPIVVHRQAHNAIRKQPAPTPDPADVLHDDVVLIDPAVRRVVGLHMTLPVGAAPWSWMRRRFEAIEWRDVSMSKRGGSRLSGIKAPSKTFGYLAPQPLRRRYTCQVSGLNDADPELTERIADLGDLAWDHTARTMPGPAHVHLAAVTGAIQPVWRIHAGPWTSGIINRNNALPYHRDSGNLVGSLSAMVAVRRGAHGGHLHLPDYGVWLGIGDRSLTVFDGAKLLHGVSPFTLDRNGRRFTLVFYARRGLRIGQPTVEAELTRAQLSATSHDQLPA